jgi:hypothetical protein
MTGGREGVQMEGGNEQCNGLYVQPLIVIYRRVLYVCCIVIFFIVQMLLRTPYTVLYVGI